MSHVEDAGDIRRGHDDAIRRFIGVDVSDEIAEAIPKLVPFGIGVLRVVAFGEIGHEFILSEIRIYNGARVT
jgi:hypothetical protein